MASVLGLDQTACEGIAKEAGCEVANLNSLDQFVFSGTVASIDRACALAEGKGAKRAMKLKVGGAFHSQLMQDAKERLEKALSQTKAESPSCAFIPNVTAEATSDPKEIKNLLARQLMSPVRWIDTMAQAKAAGIGLFLEIGPGKVLKGLARKCQPDLKVEPCGTVRDIQKCEQLLGNVESHQS